MMIKQFTRVNSKIFKNIEIELENIKKIKRKM